MPRCSPAALPGRWPRGLSAHPGGRSGRDGTSRADTRGQRCSEGKTPTGYGGGTAANSPEPSLPRTVPESRKAPANRQGVCRGAAPRPPRRPRRSPRYPPRSRTESHMAAVQPGADARAEPRRAVCQPGHSAVPCALPAAPPSHTARGSRRSPLNPRRAGGKEGAGPGSSAAGPGRCCRPSPAAPPAGSASLSARGSNSPPCPAARRSARAVAVCAHSHCRSHSRARRNAFALCFPSTHGSPAPHVSCLYSRCLGECERGVSYSPQPLPLARS